MSIVMNKQFAKVDTIIMEKELSDIIESCRVCMSQSEAMVQLFDAEKSDIVDKIEFCTGLHIVKEDNMPSKLCNQCNVNLLIAHDFKVKCLFSDEMIRSMMLNIKSEPPDYYGDDDLNTYCDKNEADDKENVTHDIGKEKKERDMKNSGKDEAYNKGNERTETGEKDNEIKDEDVESNKITKEFQRIAPQEKFKKLSKINSAYTKIEHNSPRHKKVKSKHNIQCEPCGLKFKTRRDAQKHKKLNHAVVKVWICEVCGKVFKNRSSHYSHVKAHQEPGHCCEFCDYKTSQKHDLNKHVQIHKDIKQYQCEFCTQVFRTSSNLSQHIRRKHGAGEKRYCCDHCPMRFFDKYKLNRHVDSHNDIKRYVCDVCHSAFTRRFYWKRHLERHHDIVVPPQRPGRRRVTEITAPATSETRSTPSRKLKPFTLNITLTLDRNSSDAGS